LTDPKKQKSDWLNSGELAGSASLSIFIRPIACLVSMRCALGNSACEW
jgi:hypothetical protein